MVITNNGNVGINTLTPSGKLHVHQSQGQAGITMTFSNTAGFFIQEDLDFSTYSNFRKTVGRGFVFSAIADSPDLVIKDTLTGYVGIGTKNPAEKLHVVGNVIATSFIATTVGAGAYKYNTTTNMTVPDYVFESYYDKNTNNNPTYKLMPLNDVETFIKKNKHLPRVPSREEIQKANGVNLQGMSMVNLEKTEENTLYILELHKRIEQLEKQNAEILELLKQK